MYYILCILYKYYSINKHGINNIHLSIERSEITLNYFLSVSQLSQESLSELSEELDFFLFFWSFPLPVSSRSASTAVRSVLMVVSSQSSIASTSQTKYWVNSLAKAWSQRENGSDFVDIGHPVFFLMYIVQVELMCRSWHLNLAIYYKTLLMVSGIYIYIYYLLSSTAILLLINFL